jgi:phosphatidylserine decarboxylase
MLFIALQRLTPQHLLSRAAGLLASTSNTTVKNLFIRWFVQRYNVDMSQALVEDPCAYANFNAFFTRALKPGTRVVDSDPDAVISPADGAISQLGTIDSGRVFQAKGQTFSVVELLGGDIEAAGTFTNGSFITVYLSPRDYHRVHMPFTGTLTKMTYVPGDLFSVNTVTAEEVPRLFARNERVVCHFATSAGPMVVVLVGAMIVASIETVWAGLVAPLRRKIITTDYVAPKPIHLNKGDELGRFLLGSTAIVLFPKGVVNWRNELAATSSVQMGQNIGRIGRLRTSTAEEGGYTGAVLEE